MSRPAKRGPKADRGLLKDSILDAAAHVFAASGFVAATMQNIADEAGVDKKLIHYYFGTKEDLFIAMVQRVFTRIQGASLLAEAFNDPAGDALEKYVVSVMEAFEDPETGPALISVLRSLSTYQSAAEAFMRFIHHDVIPIGEQTSMPDAQTRLTLVGTQLAGLLTARYILRAPAIVDLSINEAVRAIVPALRVSLTHHSSPQQVPN
ncbi:TetR family transcriptional regulator [Schaalia sp. ZJ405]|uniref:TetR/AcrR family transcriptional regulator n=1 Tax=Schaalia sp. ZJ405 TaxID=2709403 RepID=UPI0013EA8076|nr:TetR family transcriptional regulator [Schaalia sp. ZJ405]QPK81922.1 TetR family transcriptional regulator [Schaalia sp. ZJ405]